MIWLPKIKLNLVQGCSISKLTVPLPRLCLDHQWMVLVGPTQDVTRLSPTHKISLSIAITLVPIVTQWYIELLDINIIAKSQNPYIHIYKLPVEAQLSFPTADSTHYDGSYLS